MTKKDYKKKVKERYQNIFKEKEEEKKQRYVCERYKILSKDGKQSLLEYSNKFYKMEEKCSIIIIKKYFHSKNGFFQVCIRNFFFVTKSIFFNHNQKEILCLCFKSLISKLEFG